MIDQYVLFTGSKNNAGDYLIKHRAKALLDNLRPDRTWIDMDCWKPLNKEQLDIINDSRALLLTGGPSIQQGAWMRRNIYPLVDDLSKIKVPIIFFGSGYKGPKGTWEETNQHSFDQSAKELFQKISQSNYKSSVRDYHTKNVLSNEGLDDVLMTGCPALYEISQINKPFNVSKDIKRIGYSLGVSYLRSKKMTQQMKEVASKLKSGFPDSKVEVIFHHKMDRSIPAQAEMISWFEKNGFECIDISGSEKGLIDYYSACDLHVGYRVHAHIFRSSISQPSLLIAEDGRGTALKNVIGGLIFESFSDLRNSKAEKVANRLVNFELFEPANNLATDIVRALKYDIDNEFIQMKSTRYHIDSHFEVMKKFIAQLP